MKLVARIARSALEQEPILRVPYPPHDVVVVLTEAGVFALEDSCNHAGASLAEGWVERHCLVCPVHEYAFDLATGELVRPKGLCADQRTFVVREEGSELAIYDPFQLVLLR